MGIRIDGNTDLINAADGSLTVEGLSINGKFTGWNWNYL